MPKANHIRLQNRRRAAAVVLSLPVAASLCFAVVSASAQTPHPKSPISFNNDIEPILTHSGCNQGTCHGSQFGKGGFKLTLAGYDPEADYESIIKQAGGRRITITDPAESLLLKKPSLGVAHVG